MYEKIHYGTHFTNMFMRNCPERVSVKRIHDEHRLKLIDRLRSDAFSDQEVKG
jgi:2-oxoglutarate dioxygenase / 2-oxoglutarate/L-arginine monooxygenase/decarboxylase